MIGGPHPRSGRKPGDRRVRVEAPKQEVPTTIGVHPGFVARHWWDRVLYNQSSKRLKSALVEREHTVIADVPYRSGH